MKKKMEFKGILPALLASFDQDGKIDEEGFRQNIRYCYEQGVAGIVCNGSTGEAVALTREERVRIIKIAVEESKGKGIVVAGTGAPVTRDVIAMTQDAKEAGADAALVITPFCQIPNTEGLLKHYEAINNAVDLPLILYNIPQHTGVEIDLDTLGKLVELENVCGLKDSSGNLSYLAEAIRRYGDKISILTGCDDLLLQSFVVGSKGAILAIANIAPAMVVQLLEAVNAGDLEKARELYFKLLPIGQAIGAPANFPAPVKEAVAALGRPAGPARMPIVEMSAEEKANIRSALQAAGLL